jgi:hypothetical protein
MKKGIVALVLALAFVGLISAASAAVITGTQSYSYLDDGEGFYTGFSSGSTQDLQIAGATVATANVNNWQDLWVNPADPTLENPVVAMQYGATKLTLNNYQEPGNLMNTIKDFQFESKQGGVTEFMSEGVDSASSWMGGSASASTNEDNNILLHDIDFVDSNYGSASSYGYNAEIKHGVYNWDAVSAANVVLQDSMTEHADIASGMSIGAYTEAKIQPGADFGYVDNYGYFDQWAMLSIDNEWY